MAADSTGKLAEGGASALWDPDLWEPLLASLKTKRVVPIIGPELALGVLDGANVTIGDYVAKALATELQLDIGQLQQPSVNDVIRFAKLRSGGNDDIIYAKISRILATAPIEPSPVLKTIARITDFKLYVTLSYDTLLETAIQGERGVTCDRTLNSYYPPDAPSCDLNWASDASQPWPGPIPFDESAQAFFYGRDTAVDELLRLIARDVGVTLFGRSGLGKTSLLQAGVFPKLREATFLPVPIRLSYSQDDGIGAAPAAQGNDLRNQIGELVPDLVVQVAQRLFQTMEDARIVFPQLSQHDDLWSYLHRADFVDAVLSQGAIPVFVFDQFEELFTRGMADPARQQDCVDLLDLLADLIQGRVPNALRHRFEHFPDAMAQLRLDQPAYRIVIALRED